MTHAGAFAADARFALAGCIDRDHGRAQSFASAWSIPRVFEGLNAALADPPPTGWDIVSVCTPDDSHGQILERLLGARPRLVFCEKPLDTDAVRAARIVDAYRAAGVSLAVNHLRQWDPAVAELRAALASGAHGQVQTVIGLYTKGLWHNGSHMIDLIANLLGEPTPEQVLGMRIDHTPADPTIDVRLRLADATPVTLLGGDARSYPLFELTIVCAAGTVTMEEGGFAWRVRAAEDSPEFPGHRRLGPGTSTPGGIAMAMAAAADNIASHLTDGTPLACDGARALRTLECCAAIAAMAQGGAGSP